jgi:hypothetical protein
MWSELGHHVVWYIHGYECFGGVFMVCLHRPSDDGCGRPRPNRFQGKSSVLADYLDYTIP